MIRKKGPGTPAALALAPPLSVIGACEAQKCVCAIQLRDEWGSFQVLISSPDHDRCAPLNGVVGLVSMHQIRRRQVSKQKSMRSMLSTCNIGGPQPILSQNTERLIRQELIF